MNVIAWLLFLSPPWLVNHCLYLLYKSTTYQCLVIKLKAQSFLDWRHKSAFASPINGNVILSFLLFLQKSPFACFRVDSSSMPHLAKSVQSQRSSSGGCSWRAVLAKSKSVRLDLFKSYVFSFAHVTFPSSFASPYVQLNCFGCTLPTMGCSIRQFVMFNR